MKYLFANSGRVSRPTRALLGTYTSSNIFQKNRKKWIAALIIFAVPYGAFFSLTQTFFLLRLLLVPLFLSLIVIWMLPDDEVAAPTAKLRSLFFIFMAGLLLWPDYLALSIPGLPWITVIRLVGFPLALTLILCLSLSSRVRSELQGALSTTPIIRNLLYIFIVIAVLSVGFSSEPSTSIGKLTIAVVNWFCIFFAAVIIFRENGRLTLFAYGLWAIAIIVSVIGVWEWRYSQVPWAGHIPRFLAVQDESVQRILAGSARAATGKYRVQSKFTTPLGLAEYYALMSPFLLHFLLRGPSIYVRLAAAATIPFIFWMIILTDSRLGAVGFLSAIILYVFVWGFQRWKYDSSSLFGPAVVLSYPAIFVMFVTATFFVHRLRAIVWGSGAQTASNESRQAQIAAGIPRVFEHPWGYGIGRSAEVLGFTNGAGILTIDTYWLGVALEYGLIGFIAYYGMFGNAVWNGVKRLGENLSGEEAMIAPITISLVNFIIIKSIFSQQDSHALVFALLGALVVLCFRIDKSRGRKP